MRLLTDVPGLKLVPWAGWTLSGAIRRTKKDELSKLGKTLGANWCNYNSGVYVRGLTRGSKYPKVDSFPMVPEVGVPLAERKMRVPVAFRSRVRTPGTDFWLLFDCKPLSNWFVTEVDDKVFCFSKLLGSWSSQIFHLGQWIKLIKRHLDPSRFQLKLSTVYPESLGCWKEKNTSPDLIFHDKS